jgi:hypothetical protein
MPAVMPHVTLVPLVGIRIREEELLALGMSLPGRFGKLLKETVEQAE